MGQREVRPHERAEGGRGVQVIRRLNFYSNCDTKPLRVSGPEGDML